MDNTYGKYIGIKTNVVGSDVDIFVMWKNEKLYKMIKMGDWKNHKIQIKQFFLGYNDAHQAMKFKVPVMLSDRFADNLKHVIDSQLTLFEVSNITYDDYKSMSEKRERDNFNAFMAGLSGNKNKINDVFRNMSNR